MDKPNIDIKSILGKLSFLKNNIALMVPIIIAIVALLLFIPTRILGGKLRGTVEQDSARTAQRIDGLMRQVDEVAQAQAFDEYIEAYARDANEIENIMLHTTQRELLSYQIFPDTNESSTLLFEQFGQRYISRLETLLASLTIATPPTDSEIEAALQNAPRPAYMTGRRSMMGGMSRTTRPGQRSRRFSSRGLAGTDRKIVDTICQEKAQAAKVYVSPVNLAGYTYWGDWVFETRDDAYLDCWYWQLGHWVIEDVVAAIRDINADAASVLDAPVKRLMNVNFVMQKAGRSIRRRPRGTSRRRRGTSGENKEYPTYVTSAQDGLTAACTGRYTNEELEVIHFEVRAIVAAKDVLSFMEELCSAKEHTFRGWYGQEPAKTYKHNQITVLESSIGPVEETDYEHDLYRYGDDPVVDLDLICEYIFEKAAYEEIKPEQVKTHQAGEEDTGRR